MDAGDVRLEPIYSEIYDLSYTCLLIPRDPGHQLKGNLGGAIAQWIEQICLSYRWRIEFLNVFPEYVQWGVRVVPSTQIGQFMKEIRQKTSELVTANFSDVVGEDLPEGFWAPGYLVVLGTRPHPKEMVAQYIRLSRRHQSPYPA